jgi:aspartate aminotransferase
MSLVSDRITKNIKPSPTLMTEVRAAELRERGFPVISLGTGEPDFATPLHIREAAIVAMNNGYTKYTPSGGLKEIKNAIISKFKRENNIEYAFNEVCVNSGAKQTIYNALMATLNPEEEVIIVAPYWVSYPEMVKLAGGKPVIVNCNAAERFGLDVVAIEKAITSKTKWIMLNSPNNPSGVVYSYDELRKLADMLLRYEHVYVLSDDIYEHLVYDDVKFYTIAQVEPKLKSRTLTVNGVSKAYAMTGWRIGYCGGPAELIKAMTTIQSQSTSNPCSISQMAAANALDGPQGHIQENNKVFVARRNMTANLINQMPGLKCDLPHGAFYLFVDCRGLFTKKTPQGNILKDSIEVANYFIEQAYVAVVAGSPFGVEGFFRISYATSSENLQESCKRLKLACEKLA